MLNVREAWGPLSHAPIICQSTGHWLVLAEPLLDTEPGGGPLVAE